MESLKSDNLPKTSRSLKNDSKMERGPPRKGRKKDLQERGRGEERNMQIAWR